MHVCNSTRQPLYDDMCLLCKKENNFKKDIKRVRESVGIGLNLHGGRDNLDVILLMATSTTVEQGHFY